MRSRALSAVLGLAIGLGTGCASRAQPYRFASPLLGNADVPDHLLPDPDGEHAHGRDRGPAIASRRAAPRRVGGWQADSQQGAIRSVSAHGIDTKQPIASAEVASAIGEERYAREVVWSRLPAPHRGSSLPAEPGGATSVILVPAIREPSDLRGLVGQRDKREPFAIVLGWLDGLGITAALYPTDGLTDGPTLVSWAGATGKLAPATAIARPGDLLVFDRAVSENGADLIALVIGRDGRGVTEFMYVGGGVIRRGFLDPTRPSIRRDIDGSVVNTFLRHVKRYPPRGTRYLTGELLAHVIRTR